jgi:hypothetical protein
MTRCWRTSKSCGAASSTGTVRARAPAPASCQRCRSPCFTGRRRADWSLVAPLEYLGPFLEVIRSPETSGPITGVALTSVCRMLDEFTLGARSGAPPARRARAPQRRPAGPRLSERVAWAARERAWRLRAGAGAARGAGESGADLAEAMRLTAEAVTQCKFEATDPAADEVVLFKILQVRSAARTRARRWGRRRARGARAGAQGRPPAVPSPGEGAQPPCAGALGRAGAAAAKERPGRAGRSRRMAPRLQQRRLRSPRRRLTRRRGAPGRCCWRA